MAMRKTQETYRAHEDTEDGRPGTRPGRFQLHMRVSGRILRGAPKKKKQLLHINMLCGIILRWFNIATENHCF